MSATAQLICNPASITVLISANDNLCIFIKYTIYSIFHYRSSNIKDI